MGWVGSSSPVFPSVDVPVYDEEGWKFSCLAIHFPVRLFFGVVPLFDFL